MAGGRARGAGTGSPAARAIVTFRRRVAGAIERLATRDIGETIAVVAHGGVINAYLAEMLGMPTTLWLTVENTSITLVLAGGPGGGHGVHVVVAGDCHHLHDPVLG